MTLKQHFNTIPNSYQIKTMMAAYLLMMYLQSYGALKWPKLGNATNFDFCGNKII